ncbi:hypothetical protein [Nocardioides sp. LML1-1-1.1]|uniref:hypothetical protein n=1 Tax=Nocardioides sp. LML1-1-1.1 TaxID=3135248 RepID=UPI003425D8FE
MLPRLVLASFTLATLSLAGCGGSDDDPSGTPETELGASRESVGPEGADTTEAAPTGEVPDPCTLLDTEQLTDLLGADPGEGSVAGPVPDQRKICTFSTGVILAVEVAADWDETLVQLEKNAGKDALEPAAGVGTEAYWQEKGQQLIALGEHYFVGVTGADQAAGKAVAEGMLAAL